MRCLKKVAIIDTARGIQSLKISKVNFEMKEILINTNKRILDIYGSYNMGIMVLL
jgi:hypothetical protein